MKIKLVVIDLEIPAKVKRWGLRLGVPTGVLLLGGSIAWAAGLHSWNDGDTLSSSDLNGNFTALQSEIDALQAQITTPASGDGGAGFGTRAPSAFSAYETAGSGGSIAVGNESSSATNGLVAFDHEDYDLGDEFDTTTGKFTAKNPGVYSFTCSGEFFAGASGPYGYKMILQKNGADAIGDDVGTGGSNYGGIGPRTTTFLELAAGDTITCRAWASNPGGTTLDVNGIPARMQGARLY